MNMLPSLVFDLDGTLMDSAPVLVEVINEMLLEQESERVVTVADARPFLSHGGRALVSGLLGPESRDLDHELAEFRRRYADRPACLKSLFPGVVEGLHELYRFGFTMAVCSNKPQHLCDKVLNEVGLARFFDAIVGSSPVHRPKPDPELMHVTLRQLRSSEPNAILIGDSEVDHDFALRSGVEFLFVDYGYASSERDFSGVAQFSCFVDLVVMLKTRYSATVPLRRVA
jgi:phosphoglycolate phosphatase